MNQARQLAFDPVSERSLHILTIPSLADLPNLDLGSAHIGVLLICDSVGESATDLMSAGKKLIDMGAVHFCCWGPGCENMHDAIDHADYENERPNDEVLMTTRHDDEPLSETLWFFLNAAFPHEVFIEGCRASVAIVVDNPCWARECTEALSHPRDFSERTLRQPHGAA